MACLKNKISQPALHKRFTKNAVEFLKQTFKLVLVQRILQESPIKIKDLSGFHNVILFDSTAWVLPSDLKNIFPGCGGNRSQAGCKAQLCYDFTQGEITFFDLSSGIESDQNYRTALSGLLSERDLVLIDQGYFSIKILADIATRGAYFLTRYLAGTTLYDVSGKKLFLYKKLKRSTDKLYSAKVLVGSNHPVPARLICLHVDRTTAEQRRRKVLKDSKRKGRTPSKQLLQMCSWIILLTNAPNEKLPVDKAYPLYRLRWQIEILFKQLKSVLRLNQCKTVNVNRLYCEVYGRMTLALVVHRLHACANALSWKFSRIEISMEKFYKRIQERCFIFLHYALISPRRLLRFVLKNLPFLLRSCIKQHQKSRQTSLQRIMQA